MASDAAASEPGREEHHPTGLAHVATVSFLGSRLAPGGAFFIALAGGVALARTSERRGGREGYGASIAAMLQTVAIIGPARFNGPLTQALTAPMLGRLEARGVRPLFQGLACAAIRLVHNALLSAAAIWILVGREAFTGSYENLAGRLPLLPDGEAAALAFTAASIVAWTIFASTVQVIVYRRGLHNWPEQTPEELEPGSGARAEPEERRQRFDPRAVVIAATVAFVLLLLTTEWVLLGAVAAFLVLASIPARLDREVIPAGVAFALLLGGFALFFGLTAEIGLDETLRRGARAALLVLTATWMRAAAGSAGLREVFRRMLMHMRFIPALREAGAVLAELDSGRRLIAAAKAIAERLAKVPMRPAPIVDATLEWVARESRGFRAAAPGTELTLRLTARDGVLVLLGALPTLALPGLLPAGAS